MHIPEGFISPQTYLPVALIDVALWAVLLRNLRHRIHEETLPFLGVAGAVLFVLSSVMIPIPGGTSIHLLGIGILTALFGLRITVLLFSVVLLIQSLIFGQGGVSTYFVNLFAIGFVGPLVAETVLIFGKNRALLFTAGFAGVVAAAVVTAVILGIQPLIAHDASGEPLFFPFGLGVALPAIVLPHLIIGAVEGVITALAVPRLREKISQ